MDQRTRDEIQEALRSADRALRLAEDALLRVPVEDDVRDSRITNADPAEQALSDFLFGAVEEAKTFEEQDPQSFRARFEPMLDDLLQFVLTKRLYQEGPRGSGTTQLDPTGATQVYEQCLQACTENNINQTELMTPFVEGAYLKNWGDVDADADLVFMRYETPSTVVAYLDGAELAALVEQARKVPGAVDRVQGALREAGIQWKMSDASGNLTTHVDVAEVKGQWAATVMVGEVVDAIVNLLAVVAVDYDNPSEGWWDAARVNHDLPRQLLPIVRGREKSIVCHRGEVAKIIDWAKQLPGWSDGTPEHPAPLTVRPADVEDILA